MEAAVRSKQKDPVLKHFHPYPLRVKNQLIRVIFHSFYKRFPVLR